MTYRKTLAPYFFILITLLLAACGGSESQNATEIAQNDHSAVAHPLFSWQSVSTSPSYEPSGDISDTTPSFSWSAIPSASKYQFGHEDVESSRHWREYNISAATAACQGASSTQNCAYTPTDNSFSIGDQKAWWVRAYVSGSWQAWSSAHVFKIIRQAPINTTTLSPIAPVGNITTLTPKFSWVGITGATDYEVGFENSDVFTDWRSIVVSVQNASCQSSTNSCSFTPTASNTGFSTGDKKRWWVRAKVSGSWGEYSSGLSFNIAVNNPPPTIASGKLLPPSGDKIYFGSFADFGYLEDDVTSTKISKFDSLARKPTAWSYFSNNWMSENGTAQIKYPKQNIHTINSQGKTPFIRLIPWKTGGQITGVNAEARASNGRDLSSVCHNGSKTLLVTKSQVYEHKSHGDQESTCDNTFSMQNIINGRWDSALRQWAKDAKADRGIDGKPIPLLLTFSIEMNGYWFPWSGIYNGGAVKDQYGDHNLADGPERFRDAYRHIIDLFKEEGVNHVTWFFVPDTLDPNEDWVSFLTESWNDQKNYYPGDEYIDWIGTNLYGAASPNYEWTNFSDDLAKKARAIKAITSNKPVALLEFGVIEDHSGGSKSAWLRDAFNTILNGDYLSFKAISYWHDDLGSGTDGMKIDSSSTSLSTFRGLVNDSRFISTLKFK